MKKKDEMEIIWIAPNQAVSTHILLLVIHSKGWVFDGGREQKIGKMKLEITKVT